MNINTEFMIQTFKDVLAGIPVTLELTFITLLISAPIAFFMALQKLEQKKVGGKIVSGYVSFVRGTPIVLQILFLYSLLPTLLNYLIKEVLKLEFDIFALNPIVYAFIVFSLNTIAVLSEVFRSALLTVAQGQMEAALSIGLSKRQAYIRIIIPQALVSALPNLCNATISLMKSTSLAFMMTVKDVTAIAKVKAAYGYNYIEAYLVIAVVYIFLCSIIQLVYLAVEKRVSFYKKIITT